MSVEAEKQRDELHRKIGRNIILLQRIEMGLKSIVPRSDFTFSTHQLDSPDMSPQKLWQQHSAQYALKTMGCLSRLLCERILDPTTNTTDTEELSKGERRVRISFKVLGPEGERLDSLEESLRQVVEKRNRIVHHLFTSFDLDAPQGLHVLDTFLDDQHKEALAMFENLKSWHESMRSAGELVAADCFSIGPTGCLDDPFVQMLVVVLLWEPLALNQLKEDGWCSLALAGQLLRQYPDVLAACQKKFKTDSLKKILAKTELFDLREKGCHFLYRIKPEYWLEVEKGGTVQFCRKIPVPSGEDGILKQELDITLTPETHPDAPQTVQ